MKVRSLMSLLTTFSPRGQLRRIRSSSSCLGDFPGLAGVEDGCFTSARRRAQRGHQAVEGDLGVLGMKLNTVLPSRR
jgi:hypothetical protein